MYAADLANGRLMDGFRINTFLDRGAGKHSRSLKNSGVGAPRVEKVERREVALDKGLDERTYKEALMFNRSKGDVDGVSTKIVNDCGKPSGEVGVDPLVSEKLKVWVSLEGLPLEAWSESTLLAIGSRWGRIIQIDSDSVERKRLDKARLLLGVKCLSRIPPQIAVMLNGELYFLKVSCAAFEDEHRWIDGSRPTSAMKISPGGDDGELRKLWRGKETVEILENSENGDNSLTEFKTCGMGGTSAECVGLGAVGMSREEKHLELDIADGHSGLKEFPENLHKVGESFSTDQSNEEQLYEVQVDGGADSNMSSSHSVHIEPILDPASGLYSIKPRLFTRSKRNNMVEMCSTFINRSRRVGFSPSEIKGSKKGQEVESREDRYEVQGGKEDVGKLNQLGDLRMAEAKASLEDFKCALINVYGPHEVGERSQMFDNLRKCIFDLQVPVIIGGDFNVVRTKEEKIGVSFQKKAMREFSGFIETMSLVDIPLVGGRFTWSNFREDPSFSRLDRFLISAEVLMLWFDVIQSILPKSISDHNPVCLSMVSSSWGPRPFKWFNFLADDKDYVHRVEKVCSESCGAGIGNILRNCKRVSKDWVSNFAGESKVRIKEVEELCEVLEQRIADGIAVPSSVSEL
ncbi:hypothetical protein V6N13_092535 [Hibiscus sabdariffa]